jgi:hypothetical protein
MWGRSTIHTLLIMISLGLNCLSNVSSFVRHTSSTNELSLNSEVELSRIAKPNLFSPSSSYRINAVSQALRKVQS